jgi:phosphatidylglycerophosphate synthase
MSKNENHIAACILLSGAISDFLDGYIARKYGLSSRVGEILDPVADKIFMGAVVWGVYAFFTLPSPTLLIIAICLTVRDVFLLISGAYVLCSNTKPFEIKSIFISKLCTALIFGFYCLLFKKNIDYAYMNIFGYFIVLLIIITLYVYAMRYYRTKD